MKKSNLILLPGLNKQLSFLESRLNISDLKILIVGPGTSIIAKRLKKSNDVEMIVEDYDSLMSTKLDSQNHSEVKVRLMDFERTDFENESFDLVYVQGSTSDTRRKKITKEIKRIIKHDGYFCVGEVIKLQDDVPNFVHELFNYSNLDPLVADQFISFYEDRKFDLVDSVELSNTLPEYYRENLKLLIERIKTLNSSEISYYKKILNQISHESNVYLKLGGNRFIGFKALLLKKVL